MPRRMGTPYLAIGPLSPSTAPTLIASCASTGCAKPRAAAKAKKAARFIVCLPGWAVLRFKAGLLNQLFRRNPKSPAMSSSALSQTIRRCRRARPEASGRAFLRRDGALHKIDEDARDLFFVGTPFGERNQRHLLVLDGQLMNLAAGNEFVRDRGAGSGMGLVVARDDDGRHLDGAKLLLGHAHDRMLAAGRENLLPAREHLDEFVRRQLGQIIAAARVLLEPLLPRVHGAARFHAAPLGGGDELPVIVFTQPVRREGAPGDAQQQQATHGLRILQIKPD